MSVEPHEPCGFCEHPPQAHKEDKSNYYGIAQCTVDGCLCAEYNVPSSVDKGFIDPRRPKEALPDLEEAAAKLENLPSIDGGYPSIWWTPEMDRLAGDSYGSLHQLIGLLEDVEKKHAGTNNDP